MKNFLYGILLFLTAVILVAGSVLWAQFAPVPMGAAIAMTAVGAAGLLAAIAVNLILTRRKYHAMMNGDMGEMQDHYDRIRERIRKDPAAARKEILRTAHLCRLYAAALLLCAVLLICGVPQLLTRIPITAEDDRFFLLILPALALTGVLFMPLSRVFLPFERTSSDEQKMRRLTLIEKDKAPFLYALAQQAAEATSCRKPFLLFLETTMEHTFAVGENNGVMEILVSPVYLALLTQKEIYAVLLHEFAHIVHKDPKTSRRLIGITQRFSKLPLFYSFSHTLLNMESDAYLTYASPLLEAEADKVSAQKYAQTAIDAFAKSAFLLECFRFPCRELNYELYASETPVTDYFERYIAYADNFLHTHEDTLRPILMRTLPSRRDSHPTLRMRMEAAGIDSYDISAREEDEAFRGEVSRLVAASSALVGNDLFYNWKEAHQDCYVDCNEEIAAFEEAYAQNNADEYLWTQAIRRYFVLDKERMISMTDEALADAERKTDARRCRCIYLAMTDDPHAVEEMRALLYDDPLLAEHMIELYMDTVLRTGDEALLARIRAEQPVMAERARDTMKAYMKLRIKPKNLRSCNLSAARIAAMQKVACRLAVPEISEIRIASVAHDPRRNIYLLGARFRQAADADKEQALSKAFTCLNNYCDTLTDGTNLYLFHVYPKDVPLWNALTSVGTKLN